MNLRFLILPLAAVSGIAILFCQSAATSNLYAQKVQGQHHKVIIPDTSVAREYFTKGNSLYTEAKLDSSTLYFEKAARIYRQWGEQHKEAKYCLIKRICGG